MKFFLGFFALAFRVGVVACRSFLLRFFAFLFSIPLCAPCFCSVLSLFFVAFYVFYRYNCFVVWVFPFCFFLFSGGVCGFGSCLFSRWCSFCFCFPFCCRFCVALWLCVLVCWGFCAVVLWLLRSRCFRLVFGGFCVRVLLGGSCWFLLRGALSGVGWFCGVCASGGCSVFASFLCCGGVVFLALLVPARLAPRFPFLLVGVFVGSSVVAFAGSRSLPVGFAPLVASVAARVVASGSAVAVGCCVGVDAVVLSAVPPRSVLCFAAFAASGAGSCSLSSVAPVRALSKRGGSVSWLAGGVLSAPLPVRLAARTRAVVAAASVCAVVFFASPASRGSLLAAGAAVRRGLPVFAFACGFPASLLPLLGVGSWVAVSSGVYSGGFSWESHQSALF